MLNIFDESKEAAKIIKDQDVIFLIGPTGAGKSTTTHFLAGSRMERVI